MYILLWQFMCSMLRIFLTGYSFHYYYYDIRKVKVREFDLICLIFNLMMDIDWSIYSLYVYTANSRL